MKISDINPHIRFAKIHYRLTPIKCTSICYDCRLFFIKSGSGTITVQNQKYDISNNTVIYLPPRSRYQFHFEKNTSYPCIIVLDFDLINDFAHITKSLGTANEENYDETLSPIYELPEEFAEIIIAKAAPLCEPLTKCTQEFLTMDYLYRESSSAFLKWSLLELLRKYSLSEKSEKIDLVLSYIHENYSTGTLTNETIAEKFNYHPYYLSCMIKQATGKTLHQYLTYYRIQMGKNHLITTDLPVNTVAWKCGFNSVAYFIKTFKEYTGVTPKAYRNSHMHLGF